MGASPSSFICLDANQVKEIQSEDNGSPIGRDHWSRRSSRSMDPLPREKQAALLERLRNAATASMPRVPATPEGSELTAVKENMPQTQSLPRPPPLTWPIPLPRGGDGEKTSRAVVNNKYAALDGHNSHGAVVGDGNDGGGCSSSVSEEGEGEGAGLATEFLFSEALEAIALSHKALGRRSPPRDTSPVPTAATAEASSCAALNGTTTSTSKERGGGGGGGGAKTKKKKGRGATIFVDEPKPPSAPKSLAAVSATHRKGLHVRVSSKRYTPGTVQSAASPRGGGGKENGKENDTSSGSGGDEKGVGRGGCAGAVGGLEAASTGKSKLVMEKTIESLELTVAMLQEQHQATVALLALQTAEVHGLRRSTLDNWAPTTHDDGDDEIYSSSSSRFDGSCSREGSVDRTNLFEALREEGDFDHRYDDGDRRSNNRDSQYQDLFDYRNVKEGARFSTSFSTGAESATLGCGSPAMLHTPRVPLFEQQQQQQHQQQQQQQVEGQRPKPPPVPQPPLRYRLQEKQQQQQIGLQQPRWQDDSTTGTASATADAAFAAITTTMPATASARRKYSESVDRGTARHEAEAWERVMAATAAATAQAELLMTVRASSDRQHKFLLSRSLTSSSFSASPDIPRSASLAPSPTLASSFASASQTSAPGSSSSSSSVSAVADSTAAIEFEEKSRGKVVSPLSLKPSSSSTSLSTPQQAEEGEGGGGEEGEEEGSSSQLYSLSTPTPSTSLPSSANSALPPAPSSASSSANSSSSSSSSFSSRSAAAALVARWRLRFTGSPMVLSSPFHANKLTPPSTPPPPPEFPSALPLSSPSESSSSSSSSATSTPSSFPRCDAPASTAVPTKSAPSSRRSLTENKKVDNAEEAEKEKEEGEAEKTVSLDPNCDHGDDDEVNAHGSGGGGKQQSAENSGASLRPPLSALSLSLDEQEHQSDDRNNGGGDNGDGCVDDVDDNDEDDEGKEEVTEEELAAVRRALSLTHESQMCILRFDEPGPLGLSFSSFSVLGESNICDGNARSASFAADSTKASVLVTEVTRGGCAEALGVRPGDLIVQVNGATLPPDFDKDTLMGLLASLGPQRPLDLGFRFAILPDETRGLDEGH